MQSYIQLNVHTYSIIMRYDCEHVLFILIRIWNDTLFTMCAEQFSMAMQTPILQPQALQSCIEWKANISFSLFVCAFFFLCHLTAGILLRNSFQTGESCIQSVRHLHWHRNIFHQALNVCGSCIKSNFCVLYMLYFVWNPHSWFGLSIRWSITKQPDGKQVASLNSGRKHVQNT